ncbi:MAG: helix-turn-helix transcriptional regulator [Clostridia bacterium]|nr:helix-turn-helix transcriptional regulator [Clostridia bacterium]
MLDNKLRYYRKKQKLTLKELSEKTGISVGYLSHLENGSRTNPSMKTMYSISQAVKASIEEVFFK